MTHSQQKGDAGSGVGQEVGLGFQERQAGTWNNRDWKAVGEERAEDGGEEGAPSLHKGF